MGACARAVPGEARTEPVPDRGGTSKEVPIDVCNWNTLIGNGKLHSGGGGDPSSGSNGPDGEWAIPLR